MHVILKLPGLNITIKNLVDYYYYYYAFNDASSKTKFDSQMNERCRSFCFRLPCSVISHFFELLTKLKKID